MEPTVEHLRALHLNPRVIALAMELQKLPSLTVEAIKHEVIHDSATQQAAILLAAGAAIRLLCLADRSVDDSTVDWIAGFPGAGSACAAIGFLQDSKLRFDWLFGIEPVPNAG